MHSLQTLENIREFVAIIGAAMKLSSADGRGFLKQKKTAFLDTHAVTTYGLTPMNSRCFQTVSDSLTCI